MKMQEFIETYCADIKSMYVSQPYIEEDYDLPFDEEIEDESGQRVKVVYAGDTPIPVLDIVSMDKSDFIKIYPTFECRELYEQYIDGIVILDGEDALNRLRNMIKSEKSRIASFNMNNSYASMLC